MFVPLRDMAATSCWPLSKSCGREGVGSGGHVDLRRGQSRSGWVGQDQVSWRDSAEAGFATATSGWRDSVEAVVATAL